MPSALTSPHWYRVAGLQPRLRAGLRISRHRVRGESWVVVSDPASGQHHRFDRHAWALLAGCDGSRTLDAIWTARAEARVAPTQEQAIRIVGQALGAQLLLADVPPQARAVLRARRREVRGRQRAALNPLALRVPLWHPDAWLDRWHARLGGLFAFVYGRAGALALALLLLGALLTLAAQATPFAQHASQLLAGPRAWLLAWLIYPLVKALHELAHAFAVKHFGGSVPSVGVTLLLLTPVPHVDATAAVAFPDKRQRAVVAAAGIATELALAALALLLWTVLEPGWARDVAAATVLVCAASSLLVNGNPLLRFDGYHVATDLLELPNLATRSAAWWRLLLRRLWGARRARLSHMARGERKWLVAYAPLSLLMQAALLAAAVVALSHWSALAAAALAGLALGLLVLLPLARALWWVLQAAELQGRRARALVLTGATAALGVFVLAALPLPQRSLAPGLVWLPEDAFVRNATEGFVLEFPLADGAWVERGTVIARLENEPLRARALVLAAELRHHEVEQAQRFATDALGSAQAADRVAQLRAEQAELEQRLQALEVRAPRSGRLVLDPQLHRVGMFVAQGGLAAQVLPDVLGSGPLVRAYVANDDMAFIAAPGTTATVTLAQGERWPARLLDRGAGATRSLPSAALGEPAGGPIALDPADPRGLTAAVPRLQLELQLPAHARAAIGARVLVSFELPPASAVEQAGALLRRLFLRQYSA